jgi:diguanylate cyclase (GGDEF)-like protein
VINLRTNSSIDAFDDVSTVLDAVPEAIVIVTWDGQIAFVNRVLEKLVGYRRGQLIDMPVASILPEVRTEDGKGLCQRRDGRVFPAEIRTSDLVRGTVTYTVCTIHDESARWEAEEELARRAMADALTGLANRTVLHDRLDNALLRARRSRSQVAVLYVDIDWFKEINDLYGHASGDEVLRHVAAVLQRAVRPSDTVARFGGDEFVVLCDPLGDVREARDIGRRIVLALRAPVDVDGVQIAISASVGVGVSWGPDTTAASLLDAADTSLYRAKDAGRGRCGAPVTAATLRRADDGDADRNRSGGHRRRT